MSLNTPRNLLIIPHIRPRTRITPQSVLPVLYFIHTVIIRVYPECAQPLWYQHHLLPHCTLHHIPNHPKAPTPCFQSVVVYNTPCGDCDKYYTVQTGRTLTTSQHTCKATLRMQCEINALTEHSDKTSHHKIN